jgi:hypothetical protein
MAEVANKGHFADDEQFGGTVPPVSHSALLGATPALGTRAHWSDSTELIEFVVSGRRAPHRTCARKTCFARWGLKLPGARERPPEARVRVHALQCAKEHLAGEIHLRIHQ